MIETLSPIVKPAAVRRHSHKILLAEDDMASQKLLIAVLESVGYSVTSATDGWDACRQLREHTPDLALLDVKMPSMNGFAICRQLKSNPATRLVPVILMTGLASVSDRILGIEAGADDFLSKPLQMEELLARVKSLLRLKDYVSQLEEAETVLFALALSIEAKDPYTEGHCQRLSNFATALGMHLDLPDDLLVALRRGGIVHDIGKIAVPEHILQKPGPLTPDEWVQMKTHPAAGEKICAPLRSFGDVLPIIRHHHERMDGSGYPDGLAGEDIPFTARILTTVDIYDALTTERPYRKALGAREALQIMREEARRGWWDEGLIDAFEGVVGG